MRRVIAVQPDLASVRENLASNKSEKRGLARSIFAKHHYPFASLQTKLNAI